MDIQRVNSVLSRAIMGLQDAELEALVSEAMAGTYVVPSPGMVSARSAYKPPSPMEMGFSPKQTRRRARSKWSRETVDLFVVRVGKEQFDSVKAHVKGVWAAYQDGGVWKVTHIPTGMVAFSGFDSPAHAKATVDAWVEEYPGLLKAGENAEPGDKDGKVAGYLRSLWREMKDIKDQQAGAVKEKAAEREWARRKKGKKAPVKRPYSEDWQKSAFDTVDRVGYVVPVSAAIRGVWAVYKGEKSGARRGWFISHAPSGMFFTSGFRSAKAAKAAVDEWIEKFPELVRAGKGANFGDISAVRSKLQPFSRTMNSIASEHGGHV